MRAILLNPAATFETIDLPGTDQLATLQALVGGYLEYVAIPDYDGLGFYCNEEGLLQGLAPSLQVGEATICGPVVFVSLDGEGGLAGLTDDDADDVADIIALYESRDPSPE
jgi:hypothetical protein